MRKRFQNHNTIKSFIRRNRYSLRYLGRFYWLRKGIIFAPINSFFIRNRTVSDFICLASRQQTAKKCKFLNRTTRKHKIEVKLIKGKFKND